jgi:hypothetical protein
MVWKRREEAAAVVGVWDMKAMWRNRSSHGEDNLRKGEGENEDCEHCARPVTTALVAATIGFRDFLELQYCSINTDSMVIPVVAA